MKGIERDRKREIERLYTSTDETFPDMSNSRKSLMSGNGRMCVSDLMTQWESYCWPVFIYYTSISANYTLEFYFFIFTFFYHLSPSFVS